MKGKEESEEEGRVRAGLVAQRVKLPLGMPASYTGGPGLTPRHCLSVLLWFWEVQVTMGDPDGAVGSWLQPGPDCTACWGRLECERGVNGV